MRPIYLAKVCLERNRWGNRQPSFRVGEARAEADHVALENLQNFIAGKLLKFVMDETRYKISN